MPPADQEFSDPALKNAVKRCWAGECAPAALKRQIEKLLGDKAGEKGSLPLTLPNLSRFSWASWPVGLAAVVLIGVVLFFEFASGPKMPLSLEYALISRHDQCCGMPHHQRLPVPIDDDAAIAGALRAKLQQPVVVFHPSDPGWQFRGAAVCRVGSTPSGHLVFVKDSGTLSIFSLPVALVGDAKDGTEYSANVNQHSIVGFVKDRALFCLVSAGGDSSVNVDGLKKMESQMLPAIAQNNAPSPSLVVVSELLRSVEP